MKVQLDTLIERIKLHGIEESEKSARGIIAQAQEEADAILSEAKNEAARIVEVANQESNTIIERGKAALKQSERDLLLTVENELKSMCEKFMSYSTNDVLSTSHLKDIISAALSSWKFGSNENIFIHLSPNDATQITREMISGAVVSQGSSIDIKVDSSIHKGFRISKGVDGNVAFDFTADTIASALSVFLTSSVRELLK